MHSKEPPKSGFNHGAIPLLSLVFFPSLTAFYLFNWGPMRQAQADSQKTLMAQGEFNKATLLTDPNLKRAAAKDFNISESDAGKLDFIQVPQKRSALYVVKSPPKHCGFGGCLFFGYFNTNGVYKKVLSVRLVDRLPVGVNSFIAPKSPECITVHTLKSYNNPTVIKKDFCFKGDRYQ